MLRNVLAIAVLACAPVASAADAHYAQEAAFGMTRSEAVSARDDSVAYSTTLVPSMEAVATGQVYGDEEQPAQAPTASEGTAKALLDATSFRQHRSVARSSQSGRDINAKRNDREGATTLMEAAYRGSRIVERCGNALAELVAHIPQSSWKLVRT